MLPHLSSTIILVLFVVTNPQGPVDTAATFCRRRIKKRFVATTVRLFDLENVVTILIPSSCKKKWL